MHPAACKQSDLDFLPATEQRLQTFQEMIRQRSISFRQRNGNATGYARVQEVIKKRMKPPS